MRGGGLNLANADVLFREGVTVADMGEGGFKNQQKSADVLYGWSLSEQNFCTILRFPVVN